VANRLLGDPWPGDVRELANALERADAVATTSRVILEDLPPEVRSAALPPGVAEAVHSLQSIEEDRILAALAAKGASGSRRHIRSKSVSSPFSAN